MFDNVILYGAYVCENSFSLFFEIGLKVFSLLDQIGQMVAGFFKFVAFSDSFIPEAATSIGTTSSHFLCEKAEHDVHINGTEWSTQKTFTISFECSSQNINEELLTDFC